MDNAARQELNRLEQALRDLTAKQRDLLAYEDRKREALRRADADALADACEREHAIVRAVADLEKRRLEAAANLTLRLAPQAPQPMRVRELAELLPPADRDRLLALRATLVHELEEVKRKTQTARRACASLLNHMTGLLNTLAGASSGAGLYGRRGAATPPPFAHARSISLTA